MYENSMKYNMKWLAGTKDLDSHFMEQVYLSEFRVDWNCYDFCTRRFFVVSKRNSEYDPDNYDLIFNDLRSAMKKFGEMANAKCRYSDGRVEKVFDKVEYCDDWWSFREELRPYDDDGHYHSSATNGDYGPGNPWDAPGMKISDFLPGVY